MLPICDLFAEKERIMYTTYSAVGTEQLQGWLTVYFELASFFFGVYY